MTDKKVYDPPETVTRARVLLYGIGDMTLDELREHASYLEALLMNALRVQAQQAVRSEMDRAAMQACGSTVERLAAIAAIVEGVERRRTVDGPSRTVAEEITAQEIGEIVGLCCAL